MLVSVDKLRRYELGALLQEGKALMGDIRIAKAQHEPTPTNVVVKHLRRACISSRSIARALNPRHLLIPINENPCVEVAVLKHLQAAGGHPAVIRLLDVIEDDEHLSIVCEFASGGDLFMATEAAMLAGNAAKKAAFMGISLANNAGCGGIAENAVKHVTKQLLSATRFLHLQGYAHRDISLENIFLARPGAWDIKLADFGLAAPLVDKQWVTREGDVNSRVGKASCAAPEAWSAFELNAYDGRAADAWSIGVCVLCMLVGTFMWDEPSASKNRVIAFLARDEGRIRVLLTSWFPRMTAGAVDFLDKLLCFVPSQRASLEEAEAHAWLQGGAADACAACII